MSLASDILTEERRPGFHRVRTMAAGCGYYTRSRVGGGVVLLDGRRHYVADFGTFAGALRWLRAERVSR
jgi:hypothetical protein